MKRLTRKLCFIVLVLALVCALGLTAAAADEFSCSFADSNGQTINGWYSQEDDCWYLFVPSTVELSQMELQLQGDVSAVSAGSYDGESGILTGAFAEGSQLTVTCGGEELRLVALQSTLPAVHIVLAEASLDQVHLDKDTKYKGSSVYLSDPNGEFDLTAEGSVEFKGRGNSTWNLYEKKGYQIKFDSKTDLMGMGKAKKWVLLANASDDSMMRTQLVYQMASQMEMAFVPEFEYVDLWINGDYRGTYIIGEKIEIGGSRLDLEDTMGALFEQDDAFYSEEDYWFYSEYLQRHFVLKESVEEDDESAILAAMDSFDQAVDEFADYLFSTPSHAVTLESLSHYIDVDSFAKYYLINEYTLNRESFITSFYWYRDGESDVIHLGPIWDFDTCMGNDGAGYTENYGNAHVMFQYLLAIPGFSERVEELMAEYLPLLQSMTDSADSIYSLIETSAELNYTRWDVLGKPNPKGGNNFCATYAEAVSSLKSWLSARESGFSVPGLYVVTGDVSDDCAALELCFKSAQSYTGMSFAVWSLEGGKDDVYWYTASRQSDGSWTCTVDLSQHNTAGMYRFDAYPASSGYAVATGQNYVAQATQPSVWIEGSVSEDGKTMTLILIDTSNEHDEIRFALWTEKNEQDDMAWYTASQQEDGSWTCTVDLSQHNGETGVYFAHAYEGEALVAIQNLYVPRGGGETSLFADVSDDKATIDISLEYAGDADAVWFAVWTQSNGQDDLVWYQASQRGMLWTATVNVSSHGIGQRIMINAYKGTDHPEEVVISGTAFVQPDEDESLIPELLIEYDTESRTALVKLINTQAYNKVWMPVWSEANSQDDMVWYEFTKQSDGSWTVTVAMPEDGFYALHVYGGYGDAPEIPIMTYRFDATVAAASGVPMYRMYDPNSGEHFYTGSTEERDFLVNAGWNYEGVAFNFPEIGAPVYRLYNPVSGDHLYTMDEDERSQLLAEGWNDEGVAFNSAGEDGVPQYRLWNPNATRGAWHFTGSTEERDYLISLGWQDQGIGWYSLLN